MISIHDFCGSQAAIPFLAKPEQVIAGLRKLADALERGEASLEERGVTLLQAAALENFARCELTIHYCDRLPAAAKEVSNAG